MGQPDNVNQLPNRARLLNPKFDDVERELLVELMTPSNLGHNAYNIVG